MFLLVLAPGSAYDADGQLTQRPDGTGALELTLHPDARGRVARADVGGVEVARYRYDPLGYRIEVAGQAGVRRRLLDAEHLEAVTDATGALVATYQRGTVIDEVVNAYAYDEAGTPTNYTYHHDSLQSVVGLSGHAGTVEQTLQYGPFGELLSSSGASASALRFTGRDYDAETGLYYYRARTYDPELGRFLSEDPLGFGGGDVNLYAYVGSNPLRFSDPSGKYVLGITLGGSYDKSFLGRLGTNFTGSVTFAVDQHLDWNLVVTPEAGASASTGGPSSFLRGLVSFDSESTVSDLEGVAASTSVSRAMVSGSMTVPLDENLVPIGMTFWELGVSTPGWSVSETIGFGVGRGNLEQTAEIIDDFYGDHNPQSPWSPVPHPNLNGNNVSLGDGYTSYPNMEDSTPLIDVYCIPKCY